MRGTQIWFAAVRVAVVSVYVAVAAYAEVPEVGEDAPPTVSGSPPPPAEAVVAVVPFEDSDEPNRIVVNLAPEGNLPLRVMLDTGATFTVFTPLFARSLGVSIRRTKQSPYRRATRLGRDLQFYVDTRSSDTGSKTGWEYGLLGGNFLQEYVVEFDFIERQVTFLNPKKFRVPKTTDAPNEAVVPIRVISGRPIVKVEMNGKSIGMLLDTGAPPPLITSGATARKLGIDVESMQQFGLAGTVMGTTEARFFETDDFALAEFEFDHMPVTVLPKGWHNQGANTGSVIGYDTLRQFTIRIDYPRERMWLRRESTMVTYHGLDYAATRKAGLFMYARDDDYFVTRVLPDSPASMLGVQPGDALIRQDAEAPDLDELMERIVTGDPIQIMRRTGEESWAEAVLPAGATLPDVASPTTETTVDD